MNALASLPPHMLAGLEACATIARRTGSPLAMFNLGTVFLRAGDAGGAEAWFREALALDPDLPEAHQNLAALLQDSGRTGEARCHRDLAFRHAPLRIETAPDERLRVLVLSGAEYGNVPIDTLLPRQTTTRLKLFVEYATEADWAELPRHDVVFNAIGDADLLPPGAWPQALARLPRLVLNPPAQVARTRRDRLPRLLSGLDDVVVPKVLRRPSGASALRFPLIVRPIGAHGGAGVTLATSAEEIQTRDAYLTEFHNYRSDDGYFRKYRVIFIDGRPFPCHLAISADWLVHYFSADMRQSVWKREEEQRFLECPAAALGPRAMAALGQIGRRLGLDYAGIDFSVLPDGRILVFEANATMIVHLDDCPVLFDYKHRAVPRIFAAFNTLLQRRSPGRGPLVAQSLSSSQPAV